MPQAYVDPEELEKFARNLKQFNAELRNSTSHLQGQFAKLGDVWRDQEHTRFAHEFQQTLGKLRSFMLTSDAFIPFLLGKAQKAREYFLDGPASKGDVLQQSGVNVYRVQGGHSQGRRSKERLQVTADGNINIQGTDALFLNFNQRERAFEFQARRGGESYIVQFRVEEQFLEYLRSIAVDERVAKLFPERPMKVDPQYPDQFGLRANLFEDLLKHIIFGSAKVLKP